MGVMAPYFYLSPHESPHVGVALATNPAILERLRDPGLQATWRTPSFRLSTGVFADLMPSNASVPLCSERLRALLDSLRDVRDELVWLPADVSNETGDQRRYFLLLAGADPHVLDKARTLWAGGDFVVRAVIDLPAARGHRVFSFEPFSGRVIVAAQVKETLEAQGITGVDYAPV
jgi:hypothetical protein